MQINQNPPIELNQTINSPDKTKNFSTIRSYIQRCREYWREIKPIEKAKWIASFILTAGMSVFFYGLTVALKSKSQVTSPPAIQNIRTSILIEQQRHISFNDPTREIVTSMQDECVDMNIKGNITDFVVDIDENIGFFSGHRDVVDESYIKELEKECSFEKACLEMDFDEIISHLKGKIEDIKAVIQMRENNIKEHKEAKINEKSQNIIGELQNIIGELQNIIGELQNAIKKDKQDIKNIQCTINKYEQIKERPICLTGIVNLKRMQAIKALCDKGVKIHIATHGAYTETSLRNLFNTHGVEIDKVFNQKALLGKNKNEWLNETFSQNRNNVCLMDDQKDNTGRADEKGFSFMNTQAIKCNTMIKAIDEDELTLINAFKNFDSETKNKKMTESELRNYLKILLNSACNKSQACIKNILLYIFWEDDSSSQLIFSLLKKNNNIESLNYKDILDSSKTNDILQDISMYGTKIQNM